MTPTMAETKLQPLIEKILKRKRVVFDAAKPADRQVESGREKATKQEDQKAFHRPIGISIGRATRASWQRTTRTVWTKKEPLLKGSFRPHQKL